MNNIILLFGGDSCERDISIITAVQLYENIDRDKYHIYPIMLRESRFYYIRNMSIDTFLDNKLSNHDRAYIRDGSLYIKNNLSIYKRIKIDSVLLTTHGGIGENGVIQGYLDTIGIPYTSSGVMASSILMDKTITKVVLRGLNIPCMDYVVVKKGESVDYVNIANSLTMPLIVKPACGGSSIGITYVSDIDMLVDAIELAMYYDDKIIIEHAIADFREYNIAIYRHDSRLIVSDIERPIAQSHDILDFDEKYMTSGKMNGNYREFPAVLDSDVRLAIEQYAIKLYNALDMNGVARFDYLMDGDDIYLNEVNTIPGSMAYYLFESKGISYKTLIDDIIDDSIIKADNNGNIIRYYNSSVLRTAKYAVNKLRK